MYVLLWANYANTDYKLLEITFNRRTTKGPDVFVVVYLSVKTRLLRNIFNIYQQIILRLYVMEFKNTKANVINSSTQACVSF